MWLNTSYRQAEEKTRLLSKMERFTNNRDKFINQLKTELLEYEIEENWKEIFSYVELSYFLRYAWSYNWSMSLNTEEYKLKRKEWNADYDLRRFNNGIYNLDRLAIVGKEISVSKEDEEYFKSVNWRTIDKAEFNGIVLDGLICKINIGEPQKSLRWNPDDEMNEGLKKLVYTIRNWKREFKEL